MEKKNTILLTVIAIATLLVAVVGATFAYFTASVQVDTGSTDKKSVQFTAATLSSATMELGNTIPDSTATVYPGYKAAKPITINKTCTEASGCQDVGSKIVVTESLNGNTDISWKLYQVDSETAKNAISCTSEPKNEKDVATGITKYWDNASCTGLDGLTPVMSSEASHTGDYSYSVPTVASIPNGGKKLYYVLVVDYTNKQDVTGEDGQVTTSGSQNAQQGQTFSITVDYQPGDITAGA